MIKNKSSKDLNYIEEWRKNLVGAKELQHVKFLTEKPL